MSNEHTLVQLASPHAVARDAIERAIPRLRELFEQSGLSLGEAGVFAELPQNEYGRDVPTHGAGGEPGLSGHVPDQLVTEHEVVTVQAIGLIDAYV